MVSEYLKTLKIRGNWNFSDLSQMTGLSESTIRRIFTDPDSNPTMDTLVKLVAAMGGSLDRMVGIAGGQDGDAHSDSAIHATLGEIRDVRQEMLEHQRQSYEREIASLRAENEMLRREKKSLRNSLYAVVAVVVALMFVTILFLIYDLTHLDRGWIQTSYRIGAGSLRAGGLVPDAALYWKERFHV